ncbi:hypothetical protein [Sphingobacterium detergens]|uniref:Uncharacterized protein n=1 Tax=Sphingobacterium detergens TaxID=1145106 RepID=A0A420BJ73_SPHD1|nr:hypothetical protein [Sphingobacterium detergens]RKE56824.1 hypothetical protein DFQ12_1693 [Sphingobacterium detergens]
MKLAKNSEKIYFFHDTTVNTEKPLQYIKEYSNVNCPSILSWSTITLPMGDFPNSTSIHMLCNGATTGYLGKSEKFNEVDT